VLSLSGFESCNYGTHAQDHACRVPLHLNEIKALIEASSTIVDRIGHQSCASPLVCQTGNPFKDIAHQVLADALFLKFLINAKLGQERPWDDVQLSDPARLSGGIRQLFASKLMRQQREVAHDASRVSSAIQGNYRSPDKSVLALPCDAFQKFIGAFVATPKSRSVMSIAERLKAKPHLSNSLVSFTAKVSE